MFLVWTSVKSDRVLKQYVDEMSPEAILQTHSDLAAYTSRRCDILLVGRPVHVVAQTNKVNF